ncbi:uncharacterized protein ASCRUDRAFT_74683 [Ascoidea rubescens DSM 1968]|uniref:Uncharacterized protein n=1 Tax=Ascoidea rubescens DSM 1968 TaxID=1344418 RepID=A0A1D2VKX2_9ASCO|nr:hypothetical protein ASCRUDRAFT_74683 [Ascoidea rubescens DSM 1968]ODV62260.1 hypothetical protein ASCRUDRAFT_74683 [Ascoidea rubescens DSM 1968]
MPIQGSDLGLFRKRPYMRTLYICSVIISKHPVIGSQTHRKTASSLLLKAPN